MAIRCTPSTAHTDPRVQDTASPKMKEIQHLQQSSKRTQQKYTTKGHEEDTASQAGSKWTRKGSAKEESLQLGFGERGEHLCLVTGGQTEQAKEKHGEGTWAYRVERRVLWLEEVLYTGGGMGR